jgi:4-hydroxybenzoate polyprenyltransferase
MENQTRGEKKPDEKKQEVSQGSRGWKAWGQLVRIPNTFTSCADVLAGMCLGSAGDSFVNHPGSAVLGAFASIAFYWGGMALNDIVDIDEDRLHNRPGPLVRGVIDAGLAKAATSALFLLGGILACLSGILIHGQWQFVLSIAAALVLAIIGYDVWFKKTPLAPLLMGACRSLNMLLGVAIITGDSAQSVPIAVWGFAAAFGIYVMGFTIAARKEFLSEQSRVRLGLGWGVAALGIAGISFVMWRYPSPRIERLVATRGDFARWFFPTLFWVLSFPVFRRAWVSYQSLRGPDLGAAIRQAIVQILFIDAVLALVYAGPMAGLLIAALVLPTLMLSRMFRST